MFLIRKLIKEEVLKEIALGNTITAFHCGSKIPEDDFEVGPFLYSGEGWLVLGPGIYFAGAVSEEEVEISQACATAKGYCKYGGDSPYLYKVKINMTSIYDRHKDYSEPLGLKIKEVYDSIPDKYKWKGRVKGWSVTRHGNGVLGEINAWQMSSGQGREGALRIFKEIGVQGTSEILPPQGEFGKRVLEIAIFDPIAIVESERIDI